MLGDLDGNKPKTRRTKQARNRDSEHKAHLGAQHGCVVQRRAAEPVRLVNLPFRAKEKGENQAKEAGTRPYASRNQFKQPDSWERAERTLSTDLDERVGGAASEAARAVSRRRGRGADARAATQQLREHGLALLRSADGEYWCECETRSNQRRAVSAQADGRQRRESMNIAQETRSDNAKERVRID